MSATNTEILLEAGTNELEIVEFYIFEDDREGEGYVKAYYGVNVAKVLEIIRMPEITEMPEVSHPSVLGAFNLRSQIIPLLDLSTWLKKRRIDAEPPKVIVTEFNQTKSAFMVSGVTRIHRISWERVEAPNRHMSALSSDSITGVVKMEDRIVFILDLERIVSELNPQMQLKLDGDIRLDTNVTYKALIADDSALIRDMIGDLMSQAGFKVEKTNNGRECWERLVELKKQAQAEGKPITDFVQVIISDIEMPMMDGHNLTKRIRDDQVLHNLPVILFSSLITEKLRHKGESVGADDQISKPEITQLVQRAQSLILSREAMAKGV